LALGSWLRPLTGRPLSKIPGSAPRCCIVGFILLVTENTIVSKMGFSTMAMI